MRQGGPAVRLRPPGGREARASAAPPPPPAARSQAYGGPLLEGRGEEGKEGGEREEAGAEITELRGPGDRVEGPRGPS